MLFSQNSKRTVLSQFRSFTSHKEECLRTLSRKGRLGMLLLGTKICFTGSVFSQMTALETNANSMGSVA